MTDYENLDGMTIEGRLDYWQKRALKAEQALEDIKDVGRAKTKMVAELGFTEPEAHRYLQKTAMDTRRSMGALARDIVTGLEAPTNGA